jgi:hypothetical protein
MPNLDQVLSMLLLAAQAEPMLSLAIAGLWTVVMVTALRRTGSGWLLGLVPATTVGVVAGLIALLLPGSAPIVAAGFAGVASAFAGPLATLRLTRRGPHGAATMGAVHAASA